MTQMDPETSKNQLGMLKTFEINDSKPNWQKKIFPYQKCTIHLCRSFLSWSQEKDALCLFFDILSKFDHFVQLAALLSVFVFLCCLCGPLANAFHLESKLSNLEKTTTIPAKFNRKLRLLYSYSYEILIRNGY